MTLRKRLAGIILAPVLIITLMLIFTSVVLAEVDNKIDVIFTSMMVSKGEEIKVKANELLENIEIAKIQLPDGTSVSGKEASYTVTENGEYAFEVFYRENNGGYEDVDGNGKLLSAERSTVFTYVVNKLNKIDGTAEEGKKNLNTPLGTLGELFPAEWLQSLIIWELKWEPPFNGSMNENTVLTQADLDKVTDLTSAPNGDHILTNETIKNLPLLRNLRVFWIQTFPRIDDMSFFWERIGHLQKLEKLQINFNYEGSYGGGVNKNYLVDVPFLPNLKELSLHWMGAAKTSTNAVGSGYIFDGSSLNKSNLPVLEELNLQMTPLTTYEGIGSLDTLKKLDVSSVKRAVSDIQFTRNLINLEELSIQGCAVSDFSPLNSLPKLTKVYAAGQQIYKIKDRAIDYYEPSAEAILPAKVVLPDGTIANNTHFSGFEPAKSVFDDVSQTIKISNLKNSDLKQNVTIYDVEVNPINHFLEPYVTNVSLAKFNETKVSLANGTLVDVSGTFAYEVNFKSGIPTYDVSYDSKGGSSVPTESVISNGKISKPTNPIKEGYIFSGWYTDEMYTREWDFVNDVMPANNLTLYAKWNKKMVVLNEIPTIDAVDKILTVGDVFNPLEGVSAQDAEDGDLTSKITVTSNTVNLNVTGIYEVKYEVIDNQGAKATKTIAVQVMNKTIVDKTLNDATYIKGSKKPVVLTSSGLYANFEGIMIDGRVVDAKHYTVKSGSTIVTIEPEFLEDLALGNYSVTFMYNDGNVRGNLKVVEATADAPNKGPDTGDYTNLGLLGLMFVSLGGILLGLRYTKCKE